MKKRHVFSDIEQDALLLRIYAIASRKAATAIRSRFREDIVQDVLLACLEALRAGTFTANTSGLDAFITTALKQRASEIRRDQKDEREELIDYRREVMMELQQSTMKAERASMRRKVILFRPEVQRQTKGTLPTVRHVLPTRETIHRSSTLGRRLMRKAKGQTKWRVRRPDQRDRADKRVDGSNEPVDRSTEGSDQPPEGISRNRRGTAS
jgi:hypothetical protein